MSKIENWIYRHDHAVAGILTILIFLVIPLITLSQLNSWSNVSFDEGYEIIIQGEVQLHRMEYSKGLWWNYPYTEIELRTFADRTYSLTLYGFHPLEHERLYRITYTRISPLGHHQYMIGKVISIEEVDAG